MLTVIDAWQPLASVTVNTCGPKPSPVKVPVPVRIPVPPVALIVADPVLEPLHDTLVCVSVIIIGGGCVMVTKFGSLKASEFQYDRVLRRFTDLLALFGIE